MVKAQVEVKGKARRGRPPKNLNVSEAPDLHRPWFQEQHLSLTPSTLIGQLSDEALLAGKSSAMLICYKICFQILYHTLPWTLLPSQWLMEDKPDREDNKSAERLFLQVEAVKECRYISACEASWRLFSFHIHHNEPSVMKLTLHLPGKHRVVIDPTKRLEEVLSRDDIEKTMLTAYFEANQKYEEARELTYIQFPSRSGLPHQTISDAAYPNFVNNYLNRTFLTERAILAPTNASAHEINSYLLSKVPSAEKEYLSFDSVAFESTPEEDWTNNYTQEYLNSLEFQGIHSRRGVRNLLAAIPPLSSSAAVPHVYRNLNLHPLTVHPRATFNRYHILMERCLASCNLHAHYIHGIHEYFENQNRDVGLDHIRIAAEGFYDNAIYLYGIIMLCSGEPAIGEAMLDSLQWRENKSRADNCWRRIKRSIHGITDTTSVLQDRLREQKSNHNLPPRQLAQ
ncbi:hypothetical protein HID58_011203 [Brassica napus]|uniref:At2g35280-like TPR domain-containing protein n=1 Tax=Brassica napus TaxID=3708 RepID=A0ABQ8E074_BRANA|nr:hypothetical protein HID58_011203 [Brassica napus]